MIFGEVLACITSFGKHLLVNGSDYTNNPCKQSSRRIILEKNLQRQTQVTESALLASLKDYIKRMILTGFIDARTYIAGTQFCQNAAKRPDVYLFIIWKPKDDFWSTVGSRLDIRAKMICLKTATSQINNFNFTSAVAFDKYVFRF